MNIKIVFLLSLIVCNLSYGQSSDNRNYNEEQTGAESKKMIEDESLKINDGIVLLEDSLESVALLASVNAFLSSAQENSQNAWVLALQPVETQILIDEIQDVQKCEEFENDDFFKPYLTNIIPIEENRYIVKVSYIGMHKDTSMLRASFELVAHKVNDDFLISSPLLLNTQNWKTKNIQNHIFHYPYTINDEMAQVFANKAIFYDEIIKNNTGEFHYYLSKDEIDPLKLFGVEYKSDYNGNDLQNRWISEKDEKLLWVTNEGILDYDLHDLWHNRLRRVIPRKDIHRRVDCHIATLHGGIWGFSWQELFPLFVNKFVVGKNSDWLELKKTRSYFTTNGKRGERKNYTDDFIGALLVNKIEKDNGFDGVWELLLTKRTKEEEEYFEVLEKLTGISKTHYNKEVQKLIEEEINRLSN